MMLPAPGAARIGAAKDHAANAHVNERAGAHHARRRQELYHAEPD